MIEVRDVKKWIQNGSRRVEIPSARANVAAEFEVPHYIRFLVNDRPGIVAEITGALAHERINIRAIMQKAGYPQHALPFVVTVEPVRSAETGTSSASKPCALASSSARAKGTRAGRVSGASVENISPV